MILWKDKQNWQPFSQTHQEKKEKDQINKVRIKGRNYNRQHRNYYEQVHANKMNNLQEMDKVLEMYNIPKLTQEERENMNRTITINESESVIKKKKTHNKQKSITRQLRRWISPHILRKVNIYPLKLQKLHRREHFQTHSTSQHHCDTKARQKYHQKK